MQKKLPRIKTVAVELPSSLRIRWKDGGASTVDLAGWIATGDELLAALRSPQAFAGAIVADYGSAIAWDSPDLAIDAVHLQKLAEEQSSFAGGDLAKWQRDMGVSNNEAAQLFNVAQSTWNLWKTSDAVPRLVAAACRASRRDPLFLQAYYRPSRAPGRPSRS